MADVPLPPGLEFVRVTPEFERSTVPAALLRSHRVASGVWGRLVVREGSLVFVFEDDPTHPRAIVAGEQQVIPPDRLHHVEVTGPVRFAVEFYRPAGTAGGTVRA